MLFFISVFYHTAISTFISFIHHIEYMQNNFLRHKRKEGDFLLCFQALSYINLILEWYYTYLTDISLLVYKYKNIKRNLQNIFELLFTCFSTPFSKATNLYRKTVTKRPSKNKNTAQIRHSSKIYHQASIL